MRRSSRHVRLPGDGCIGYDWQHYIALVQRKPGALRNGAPFADMPQALLRAVRGLMRLDGSDKIMAQIVYCVINAMGPGCGGVGGR